MTAADKERVQRTVMRIAGIRADLDAIETPDGREAMAAALATIDPNNIEHGELAVKALDE